MSRPISNANANGNLFEIRTVQAGAVRTLIEALKEILTEANLEFDSQGIKVMAVDETHTVLVYLRLHADRFESTVTNYFLKLFDTDVEDIQIPNLNFTSIIHMPSIDLQKICRDMNALGEKLDVEITSSGSDLIFKCIGDFAEQETIISEKDNSNMKVHKFGAGATEIVQGIFQLKHLVLFTKCTSLCPSIELYLKNDIPLILRYTVANLGEVKLVLAPMKNKQAAVV